MPKPRGHEVVIPAETKAVIKKKRPELLNVSLAYAVTALAHEALGIDPPPTPNERKSTAKKNVWRRARANAKNPIPQLARKPRDYDDVRVSTGSRGGGQYYYISATYSLQGKTLGMVDYGHYKKHPKAGQAAKDLVARKKQEEPHVKWEYKGVW